MKIDKPFRTLLIVRPIAIGLFASLNLSTVVFSTTLFSAEPESTRIGRVTQIQKGTDQFYVLIEKQETDPEKKVNYNINNLLIAERPLPGHRPESEDSSTASSAATQIQTGQLRVLKQDSQRIMATFSGESTAAAKAFFPKNPGVMVGDYVVFTENFLAPREILAPSFEWSYHALFQDPRKNPGRYGLSQSGRHTLQAALPILARSLNEGLDVAIEGMTDTLGKASENLFESAQRAQQVRLYLIELGLPGHRLKAIGLGEAESTLENFSMPSQRNERQILIRTHRPLENNSQSHSQISPPAVDSANL